MFDPDKPPNIILLVWDACRLDYAGKYADNLMSLADSNLFFENAIAPSTWSPPSHASLFSGKYPHQHDIYRGSDSMTSIDLFRRLKKDQYTCFGVSGNGFLSQSTGFHEHFDELYYTSGQGPFLDGLVIYEYVFGNINRSDNLNEADAVIDTLYAVLTHEHPLKSLVNLSAVALNRVSSKLAPLQRVPHPIFHPFQPYSYKPKRNTKAIQSFLANSALEESPFFILANYMDTHRPYFPPGDIQRSLLGRSLNYHETTELNEIADPWKFAQHSMSGNLDKTDIDTIQSLYAGEVVSVDRHLGIILEELEKKNLRENTIVVITADHGENLGEKGEMNRRRIGHHSSMSDNLLRVPLLIAHPDVPQYCDDRFVSLKQLYEFFIGGYQELFSGNEPVLNCFESDDGIVVSEYPATGGGDELFDKYPNAPETVINQRVKQDSVAGYFQGWKIVIESTGDKWAWKEGQRKEFEDVPENLVEKCAHHLEILKRKNDSDRELSDAEIGQLEALGYL